MAAFSMPVERPKGRVLVVAGVGSRALPVGVLNRMGCQCVEHDDPYTAMAELSRRAGAYQSVVLSLNSLFGEELAAIGAIKRRFSHVDVWLTHTDGRAGSLAEALRHGADGLLSEEGLHRFAVTRPGTSAEGAIAAAGVSERAVEEGPALTLAGFEGEVADDLPEPVLTQEELAALLQEPPPRGPELE